MTIVNVHEAKNHFSRILEKAHAGEEIILAKAGKPWARLVPLERPKKRIPGRYQNDIPADLFNALPYEELGSWEK